MNFYWSGVVIISLIIALLYGVETRVKDEYQKHLVYRKIGAAIFTLMIIALATAAMLISKLGT